MPYGLRWKTVTFTINKVISQGSLYTFSTTGSTVLKKIGKLNPTNVTYSCSVAYSQGGGNPSANVTSCDFNSGNISIRYGYTQGSGSLKIDRIAVYIEYKFENDFYTITEGDDIYNLLYTDAYHDLFEVPNYFYPDEIKLISRKHYSSNTWEVEYYPFDDYYTDNQLSYSPSKFKVIRPGSTPSFKSELCNQTGGATYNLYISDGKLKLDRDDGTNIFSKSASDFVDGVLPDRLIVTLQAGGGGGGSASGGTWIVLGIPTPATGSDGGGGGSGAYFTIIINTALLKYSSSNKYTLVVGGGGSAGTASWTFTTASGGSGGNGGDSYIQYNGETFLVAKGGGGGTGAGGLDPKQVSGGSGGDVQDGSGKSLSGYTNLPHLGSWFWWLPAYSSASSSATSLGRSFDYGKKGSDAGKDGGGSGESTSSYYITNTNQSTYMWKDSSTYHGIGGFSGGTYHTNSGGGAASYFGAGGDGGSDGSSCHGKSGGTGAGGGGGRYLAYNAPSGGSGGSGLIQIWY